MFPDGVHFALMLMWIGGLLRIAEYLMAKHIPNNPVYKFLVFVY